MFEQYMSKIPCQTCQGQRLRPEALAVTVADQSIYDVTLMPVAELVSWVNSLRGIDGKGARLNDRDQQIALSDLEGDRGARRLPQQCRPELSDA